MSWIDTLKKATRSSSQQKLEPAERASAASDLVQMSALAAAAVTYAPLPFLDFVVITPLQVAMVMSVGRVYGRELDLKEARSILVELASVCGAGLVARQLFTAASKILLPGLGGILSGPYAFAVTWAMGKTAIGYFEDPDGAQSRLKQTFEDALAEGRRLFSKEAVEEFRRRRGKEVEDFARKNSDAAPSNKRKPARKAATAKKTAKKAPRRKAPPSGKNTRGK